MQVPQPATDPAAHRHRLAARWLWLVNVALLAVIASGYLQHVPAPRSSTMAAYLALGLVSCATTISIVPGLLTMLAGRLTMPLGVRALIVAFLWTLVALLVFLDLQIYGIFRYHFNGMVWNVLTTRGSDEAVHVLPLELWIIGIGALVLLGLELAVFRWLCAAPIRIRTSAIWKLGLIPVMVLQISLMLRAELVGDRHVISVSRIYPLVPHLPLRLLSTDAYDEAQRPAAQVGSSKDILLNYPLRPIELPAHAPTRNVVLIVVDSLRWDMFTPQHMPRTHAFARRALVFRDHLSGGNATRFGVFGLIYGLHGCYWRWIHRERHSPVLVDALVKRGYDVRILASASMSFPELRTTAWARVADSVEDRLKGTRPGGRDDGLKSRFSRWLDERRNNPAPFFAFLLLDAPHQSYAFPEAFGHFRPYAKDLSYLSIAQGPSGEALVALKNRYYNSVLYADHVVGELLDALQTAGELDRSIVIIAGDHGEELMDHGYFGHSSNFTRAQLQVPMVWFEPDVVPGEISAPTTHVDVPATLLERLGLNPEFRGEWTLGENLFDTAADRVRVVSGWDTLGLVLPDDRVMEVPFKPYRNSTADVYEPDWRLSEAGEGIVAASGELLSRTAQECRRFLR